MEEKDGIAMKGHGNDVPTGRQSSGSRQFTNRSCGCTGGGSWIFMVVVAGLLVLYVLTSILR